MKKKTPSYFLKKLHRDCEDSISLRAFARGIRHEDENARAWLKSKGVKS